MQDKVKATTNTNLIEGATGEWEIIVGLEVHAQVASASKLFSGASTAFGGAPNSHVSLVDAAMPGMLPVINSECIAQAVRTGLGIKAAINLKSVFDRKNYFYPDLPQGYQISQYKQPIVGEGEVEIDVDGETMKVGMPWDWETYPEFLDSLERTPKGVNVLSYVPLAPLISTGNRNTCR